MGILRKWWIVRQQDAWGRFFQTHLTREDMEYMVEQIEEELDRDPDDERGFRFQIDRLTERYGWSRVEMGEIERVES